MRKDASANGKFELFYQQGWAHLTVYPPLGAGIPVYPEEIENRMKLLGVPRVGAKAIRDVIAEAQGQPVPLIEWPGGHLLAAAIRVEVADDGLSATVTVHPPKKGAAPPVPEDVLAELERAGVRFGIDSRAVQALISRQDYGEPVVAALGTPPVSGRAYRLKYHFNVNRGKPYLEMEFGRINLKELNFIENRKSGDLLAELIPPEAAMDGRKVTGEAIAAETDPETAKLAPGANTLLSPDGTKLYAQCDGNVRLADGRVLVEPVITVRNVNYETGNLRFDGSVVVEGSIADGFVVEAGGDLQVDSSVGRAQLKAGGSVLLKTGINGNGEGSIECGGDLLAKYIESCTIACRGNLLAEEAIMHSRAAVHGHCVLNGRRAEVIASDLIVGGSFWCKKLGNFNEAPTRLAVGVKPELLLDYRADAAELIRKQEEADKVEHQLEQLAKALQDGRTDDRVRRADLQLRAALELLRGEIAALRNRLPGRRDRVRAARQSLAVVEETMFKGVVVSFGVLEYRAPDAGIRKTILKAGETEVIEAGFNYHERPVLDFSAAEPS